MKNKIQKIKAREILDSRGNPTVEVELETNLGKFLASVPAGASKGKYEAVELRDGGKRFQGLGVLKAVKNVNQIIAPKLKSRDPKRQKEIDELMIKLDGTENKSRLGTNSILAVSMAVCRAGAQAENLPLYSYLAQLAKNESSLTLPLACFNLVNGGVHADNELDFQEFMIVPQVQTFSRALSMTSEIYHRLKEIIKKKYLNLAVNLGDEGGFAPPAKAPEEAMEIILAAAESLNYKNKLKIFLDVAASQFFKNNKYKMRIGIFEREDLLKYYLNLISKYPIWGLEDPWADDDWSGWQKLNSKSKLKKAKLLIIGDDLLATNPKRMKLAKGKGACNAAIIKINQIGTVSETIAASQLAKSFGWKIIVSHRSGETNDDFISDLAVGLGADFIKAGAPARGERVAKYNRLLKIEAELNKNI